MKAATAQRDENAGQAAVLEVKVSEPTRLVRELEQALDLKEAEVAKGQQLFERDRDIRELDGRSRPLYGRNLRCFPGGERARRMAGAGKSPICYALDLDAYLGVRNDEFVSSRGRRGPDKQQAPSLGIFDEANVNKKSWVLKTNDPKTLEDIDTVSVTVEPNGGSHHPRGKQLLFAYTRVPPNHP